MKLLACLCLCFAIMTEQAASAESNQHQSPLIVANDAAWPPFSFLDDNGQPAGMLIELWQLVGEKMQRPVEFSLVQWQQSLDLVKNGKADIHAGLFYSELRDQYLDFTVKDLFPLTTRLFVSVKLDAHAIIEVEDLPLGVVEGGYEQEYVESLNQDLKIKLYANNEAMINAAKESQILAFVADYPVGMNLLHKYKMAEKFLPHEKLYTNFLKAAVKQNNQTLLSQIEAALATISDSELQRIQQKWLFTVEKEVYPVWLVPLLLGLFVLVLLTVSVLYNYSLKAQVKAQTQQLRRLNQQYKDLAQTAESANSQKSHFLANMSHEIRTPINGILGFTQIGLRDVQNEQQRVLFEKIYEAGGHLLAIINDILDFSKIEEGKIELELKPVSINVILDQCHDFIKPDLHHKQLGFEMHCDVDYSVIGDGVRIRQVLINLLSNAVKFTTQGSIRIDVTHKADDIFFAVSDTGIGLTAEQQQNLFKRFEQASVSTTRKFGGSGLGLSISKALAKLMQGDLSVKSEVGKGSVFTFSAKLQRSEQPYEPAGEEYEKSRGGHLQGLNILAADDVELNRLVLQDLLEFEGASVTLVENGRQAYEVWQSQPHQSFDVVLMDIQMPEWDGYEATRCILAEDPKQAVIGLSAYVTPSEIDKALRAGMRAYINKPIELHDLINKIQQCCKIQPLASNREEHQQTPTQTHKPPAEKPIADADSIDAGFDYQAMLDRHKGNQKLVNRLIQSALHSFCEINADLTQAVDDNNLADIQNLLHRSKGLLGNLGVKNLHQMAVDLETVKDKQSAQFLKTLKDFIAALEALIVNLDNRLDADLDDVSKPS